MEGGYQQIALGRVLASAPVLRYRQKFGDQCGDGFRCDGLELAAKARNLSMNPLQLGTEVFDRKLVERHNRLDRLFSAQRNQACCKTGPRLRQRRKKWASRRGSSL